MMAPLNVERYFCRQAKTCLRARFLGPPATVVEPTSPPHPREANRQQTHTAPLVEHALSASE